MNCPYCQEPIPARKHSGDPRRLKLQGHHGEMDLDLEHVSAMAGHAAAHLTSRQKIEQLERRLAVYNEVVSRMEHDPAFANHVLSYDGDGGKRFFPGATKAAKLAQFKNRVRSGDVREGDLLRYIELMMDN